MRLGGRVPRLDDPARVRHRSEKDHNVRVPVIILLLCAGCGASSAESAPPDEVALRALTTEPAEGAATAPSKSSAPNEGGPTSSLYTTGTGASSNRETVASLQPSPQESEAGARVDADSRPRPQGDIPEPKPAPPLDPKDELKARRLIQKGRVLYSRGDYAKAEEVLKEAVTLYPFLAEANLALGKIFLIRGSALRDRAMINSARLMFEMARALDPDMREPAVLLELFMAAPPE